MSVLVQPEIGGEDRAAAGGRGTELKGGSCGTRVGVNGDGPGGSEGERG